ncbi:hypothetical protein [Enterococcus sp. DIV0187]|uniref:hypothetical protein n=1 Tax=Enterococcus sp. DIV0187 TaxID=2774644 RepID=UPI003F686AF6
MMIELVLVILFGVMSFFNIQQQQETVSQKEAIATIKKENKEYKTKEQQLLSENERLSDQVTTASNSLKKVQQKYVNSGTDADLNSEFIDVVTKLFEANLNFTPENYEDRKKEVSNYLSEELNKEYFGQSRNTYQDANGTFSKLESLEVYPKGMQSNKAEGLVVVYYKSKQNKQNWIKGMNTFKVMFDVDKKKVISILNLGS